MKKSVSSFIFLFLLIQIGTSQSLLMRSFDCVYLNQAGDTIIQNEDYVHCFTDTIKYFGVVWTYENRLIAIDPGQKELFEVYNYDNGPDYLSEGLFRIIKNGLIGYANEKGKIVIRPQYECAFPFQDGKAKAAIKCKEETAGEYTWLTSAQWIYIDKFGKTIN